MSIYHKVDVEGCEYAMSIINQYEHNIVNSTHTTGETDRYDIDWTLANGNKIIVEHKDRRIKYNTNALKPLSYQELLDIYTPLIKPQTKEKVINHITPIYKLRGEKIPVF